ncbi:unnamed protein product, partial [Amoebophrya sp. A25]|eukprot:GSA25T00010521001.1
MLRQGQPVGDVVDPVHPATFMLFTEAVVDESSAVLLIHSSGEHSLEGNGSKMSIVFEEEGSISGEVSRAAAVLHDEELNPQSLEDHLQSNAPVNAAEDLDENDVEAEDVEDAPALTVSCPGDMQS